MMAAPHRRLWAALRGKADLAADADLCRVAKRQLEAWRWGLLALLAALAAGELLWGRRGDGLPFVILGLACGLLAVNHRLAALRQVAAEAG